MTTITGGPSPPPAPCYTTPWHSTTAIDGRTTRHSGYEVSQRIRKRVEEPFGWVKTVGAGRKLRYVGQDKNRAWFKMTTAVYNLFRITALDTEMAAA